MTVGNILEGVIIAVYGFGVYVFYVNEKDLLTAFLNTYSPVHVGSFETWSVLTLLAFMTLGYLGGLKRLMFALFIYHVPVKMLRGEYERYFSEAPGGESKVTIALAIFLLGMSTAGFMGVKY